MAFYLKIIDGPNEGDSFRLSPGLQIGRRQGDIILNDSQVSSLHAKIEKAKSDRLYIIDLGSANGLKIAGDRFEKVLLEDGVRIEIGQTLVEVVEKRNELEIELDTGQAVDLEGIARALEKRLTSLPEGQGNLAVAPFTPPLQLSFLQGRQWKTVWTVGYGPRFFGRKALDGQLQEPLAPDEAFCLAPDKNKILFETAHPTIVKVNGASKRKEVLKPGDRIQIFETLIEIGLDNGNDF